MKIFKLGPTLILLSLMLPVKAMAYGSSTSLTFGLTSTTSPSSQWVTLQYSGCCSDPQNFQSSASPAGPFSLAYYPTQLAPGNSFQVEITFSPTYAGTTPQYVINLYYYDPAMYGTVEYQIFLSGEGGLTGYINPKYAIVGVTYAPPGPSSNVSYENSTLVGNTTTTTDTFTSGTNVTISLSAGISAWSILGGVAAKNKATESTDYTQTSTTSNEVTISKQTAVKDLTSGTGNAFSPVNHDYDTIWLWLNPLEVFTLDPNTPANIQWNGHGYDSHDPSGTGGPDVYPVLVGWLNGDFGQNTSIQQVLSRSWVTANEPGITWPSGEGPGLPGLGSPCPPPPGTKSDICNILAADPFTSSYTLLSSLPSTSSDGRFTQISYPPNPIPYTQAGPGNGGGNTTQYNAVYTDTHIVGHGTSHSFTQSFGLDSSLSGSWLGKFTLDVSVTQTFKWTHDWMNKLTTTTTLTNAFSITGPGCPQTSPPCVPTYSGPGQFIVYQDNQYGTFLFYPSN